MQSLGFAFAMVPVLRRLYPDPAERGRRVALHMEYFNTQPYLASFILGAAARLEEELALGSRPDADVSELKKTLMAPLGALGDSFFWGSLKPLAAAAAVAALLAGAWWAPVLFLVLFNAGHVTLRLALVRLGYRTGGDVVALLSRYNFTRLASLFKAMTLAVAGSAVGMVTLWREEFRPLWPCPAPACALAGLAMALVLAGLLRKGLSPAKLMLGLAALCLALAFGGIV